MKDVIVIGMGISGITSAIYLKRAGLDVFMIENNIPGGLLNEISEVQNYPGINNISGFDFGQNLLKQVKENDIKYSIENFCNLEKTEFGYKVITNKNEYLAKKVVMAMGRIPKNIGIENEESYLGKGISTCASCDGPLYKNKNVAVVGSGSSALQEALYLSNIVNKVYLIIRKESFSTEFYNKEVLNKENIEVINNAKVVKLITENNVVTGAELSTGQKLEISCLFKYVGFIPNTQMLKHNFSFLLDEDGYIKDYKNGDIYACGDILKTSIKQLSSAASSGVTVALDIIKEYHNG